MQVFCLRPAFTYPYTSLQCLHMPNIHYWPVLTNSTPPLTLSTASLASIIPISVLTNIQSPGLCIGFAIPAFLPAINFLRSATFALIVRVGFEIKLIFRSTGSLFQYFNPSHIRRCAGLIGTPALWYSCLLGGANEALLLANCASVVFCSGDCTPVLPASYPSPNQGASSISSSSFSRDAGSISRSISGMGGFSPATWTVERRPCFCIARQRERCIFVIGIDVTASRAREAFCRCEHTFARLARTIVDCE